jgi:hypothetical protein
VDYRVLAKKGKPVRMIGRSVIDNALFYTGGGRD